MRLSVCTISAPERVNERDRLAGQLERQISGRDVEHLVVVERDTLGVLRQRCLDQARGDYVVFVDDDDLLAHDYLDAVLPLLDGVDYVGYRLQLYIDGAKQKPTYHTLRYRGWSADDAGWYRGVDIKNPIRADIARQVQFEGAYGEDRRWAWAVEALPSPPRTEHCVDLDRPMYYYFHSTRWSYASSGL